MCVWVCLYVCYDAQHILSHVNYYYCYLKYLVDRLMSCVFF